MNTLTKYLCALSLSLCLPFVAHAADPTAATKSAQEIRIPKVELREATLKEAVAYLNKKSIECDAQTKGVNIAIAGETNPDAKISLSVQDASVFDILTVVAGQAGVQIEPSETILMLSQKRSDPESMPLHAVTPKPAELLVKLKKAVTYKHVPSWTVDADGDFTYLAEAGRWRDKAWMKAKVGTGVLTFAFVIPTSGKNTATLYSIYHGRFAEMLLTHFSADLSKLEITPF